MGYWYCGRYRPTHRCPHLLQMTTTPTHGAAFGTGCDDIAIYYSLMLNKYKEKYCKP
uniref:Uncharacterized protein n=1 Tax=Octopus bimaculoides TaxID=37653 RepID=A0A0L8FMS8_OCTBM